MPTNYTQQLEDIFISNNIDLTKIKFYVQIGANDGIAFDEVYPIVRKYNWNCLLIEPVKEAFEALQKNYKGHKGKVYFENCLVTSQEDFFPFYIQKHRGWVHSSLIKPKGGYKRLEKIYGNRLNFFLKKYDIKQIDFLQIDAEGADWDIIQQIDDFKRPKIIRYENNKMDQDVCQKFLEERGYQLTKITIDTIAIIKDK